MKNKITKWKKTKENGCARNIYSSNIGLVWQVGEGLVWFARTSESGLEFNGFKFAIEAKQFLVRVHKLDKDLEKARENCILQMITMAEEMGMDVSQY